MRLALIILLAVSLLAIGPILMGFCFDYSLEYISGGDIPFLVDCIAGTFTSGILIPVTVCCVVADCLGAESPLFDITKKEAKEAPC